MMSFLTIYVPGYVSAIIYMLQSTEYQAAPYLSWYWRTSDFSSVMHRRTLQKTKAADALILFLYIAIYSQYIVGLYLVWLDFNHNFNGGWQFGLGLILGAPILWAHLIIVPLELARWLIVEPRQRRLVARSRSIFAKHPAVKIAVAGSYGKTTMKEILAAVLSEGKLVAATPANKNVAVSHAQFAERLGGREEILILEYGEGKPGDVRKFAENTQPKIGVITGIAPAHLDQYKTVDAAAQDIFSLADFLDKNPLYVNRESADTEPYLRPEFKLYDREGVDGWKVSNVTVDIDGIKFRAQKGSRKLELRSPLLGRHQIGPLCTAVAIADGFGMNDEQIIRGVAKTVPFEHRLQPRHINGAWIIDDTYNGNIEGIKVGLALLKELPAKRKLYVTPGLVDQGAETQRIHNEIGELIADANPDEVVLMKNSVTSYIQAGLDNGSYQGKIHVETDPLRYYTALDQFVASGDLVLMQNDWTDNYA